MSGEGASEHRGGEVDLADFVGEPVELPRPTPPSGGWASGPMVDGLPLVAWLSWTMQKEGVLEEDPLAGLFMEAIYAVRNIQRDNATPTDGDYLASAVESAAKHYVQILARLRSIMEERGEPVDADTPGGD